MKSGGREPAPDFTDAFLGSALALAFMALFAIWAVWGLVPALATSWIADRLILRFGQRG